MKRISKRLVALLLVLMMVCSVTSALAKTTYLTMAAVASSSGLFPYVVSIGKVLNTYCPDYSITVSESGGNVDNTKRLRNGEVKIANSISNTDYESYTGTGTTFNGNPFTDFRILWYYEKSPIQICVALDTGIETIYDLDGKPFNPGGTGTAASVVIHAAFDALGIHPNYFEAGQADAADAYANRQIVGAVKTGPSPDSYVMQLNSSRPIRLLAISDEDMAKILEAIPSVKSAIVPANSYEGVDYDAQCISTYQGVQVLRVLFQSQGTEVKRHVTFETGYEADSPINFGTLTYKSVVDRMDKKKFVDNYANYETFKDQPSMVGTSFSMGIIAMLLAYGLGLPIGILMARRKDKLADKLGMAYIIFIIAVPSLAYIYLFRYIMTSITDLPSVFTTYGPSDWRSWVLPIISLAMPSIAGLMLWTRRYVVDQMNSDYVKFAKAKGLNQREIFNHHIFKNASIPIAHGIPTSLAGCITGALITESIYSVGGMGKMLPNAIKQYNNVMVIALAFMFSTIFILSVLLGDILITKIDPRISLSEKAGRT